MNANDRLYILAIDNIYTYFNKKESVYNLKELFIIFRDNLDLDELPGFVGFVKALSSDNVSLYGLETLIRLFKLRLAVNSI